MKFLSALILASFAATSHAIETDTETSAEAKIEGESEDAYLNRFDANVPKVGQYTEPVYQRSKVEGPAVGYGPDLTDFRGPEKQPRRRDPPTPEKGQPEIIQNRTDGKFHDWREYDPFKYDGKDPYAHCVFNGDRAKLDTPEYNALSSLCKLEVIWQNVLQDTRRERFYTGFEFESLFSQDMNLTYDSVTDTMPVDRLKKTHPVGTTSKIEWIPKPGQPYTGIFKGSKNAIMRISDTTATTPAVAKTAPGFGIKMLRDGMTSANILAMFAFDGQKSFNFFKNRWTTHLREFNNVCARNTIGKHLAEVTDHLGATSVMEVAEYDEFGNKEEEPHWPFQVEFEPYDVYGWGDEWENDFQDQLSVIPMNTVMFRILAFDEPPELDGKERLIGWIVSRSDQIDSFWGDT